MGTGLISATVGEVLVQLLLCSGRATGVGHSWKHEALPSNIWPAEAANTQEYRNQWSWTDYTHRHLFLVVGSAVVLSALGRCDYKCFAGQTDLRVDHWIPAAHTQSDTKRDAKGQRQIKLKKTNVV